MSGRDLVLSDPFQHGEEKPAQWRFASEVGVHLFREANMPLQVKGLPLQKDMHFDIYRKSSEDSPLKSYTLVLVAETHILRHPTNLSRGGRWFSPILLGTFCGNSLSTPLKRSKAFSRAEAKMPRKSSGRFVHRDFLRKKGDDEIGSIFVTRHEIELQ